MTTKPRAGHALDVEPLAALIAPFAETIALGQTEIYSEFSLQHELGIYLRERLPGYRVQFERNVSSFSAQRTSWTKREIDISVFSPTNGERPYAIELK